jgi:hypothetical protein
MADLPIDRIQSGVAPFTNSGVDYFGPFHVKFGRGTVKRYGVLFTCLVTRAIHLEVADDLSSSLFINALQRFRSRRGQVQVLRSDNGTNLIGAAGELKKEVESIRHGEVSNKLAKVGIKWYFNAPAASHHGGAWERQIRTVLQVLGALLSDHRPLTHEALYTLLCEVEAIVNGRPLTTVSSDPNDLEPLSANLLLTMKGGPAPPPGDHDDALFARAHWKRVQALANLFWKRWRQEYLPKLQVRSKWNEQQSPLAVGSVVLILDSNLVRHDWLMGRVEEVYAGSDGLVRSAKIRTQSGLLVRPITKLSMVVHAEKRNEDV